MRSPGIAEVDGGRIRPSVSKTARRGECELVGEGNEEANQYPERDAGFLLLRIQGQFEFQPEWYRVGEVRDLVFVYYFVLRFVCSTKPHLRRCLKRCRHCRIFFFTHPRNKGRDDLGCPFGCREAHRKKCSTERSMRYYRTPAGKEKKRRLNGRRRRIQSPGPEEGADESARRWEVRPGEGPVETGESAPRSEGESEKGKGTHSDAASPDTDNRPAGTGPYSVQEPGDGPVDTGETAKTTGPDEGQAGTGEHPVESVHWEEQPEEGPLETTDQASEGKQQPDLLGRIVVASCEDYPT
jgi:hypothetical protein